MQRKALKQLAEGNVVGSSGGDDDMMVNWFDALSKKLLNELILLMKCAQKVLFPPAKSHGSTRITGKFMECRQRYNLHRNLSLD